MNRPLVLACAFVATLVAGCDRPSDPPPPAEGSGEEPTTAAAPTEGSAAAAPDAPAAPPSTADATAEAEETEPSLAPPALAALMRRIGYAEASEADLDAFAHLPPGATGDAGAFGSGDATVRAALIAYPNARYVAPHLNDVRERERVLPSPREAAVAHDRWIFHVMARDHDTAREVANAAADALGWER